MNLPLETIISIANIVIFGALIIPLAARWRRREGATLILSSYLTLAIIWNLARVMVIPDISLQNGASIIPIIEIVSRGGLLVTFGLLLLAFLNRWYQFRWLLGIVIPIQLISALTQLDMIPVDSVPGLGSPDAFRLKLDLLTWIIASLYPPIVLLKVLYNTYQAQFRNRCRYWLLGFVIIAIADLFLALAYAETLWLGIVLNLVGASLISYVLLSIRLPDLYVIAGHLMHTVLVTIGLSILLFAALYAAFLANNRQFQPEYVISSLGMVAFLLAIILPRLAGWLGIIFGRLLPDRDLEEHGLITAYRKQVNADWDFEKLGQQALQFLLSNIKTHKGILLISEHDRAGQIQLKPLAAINCPDIDLIHFSLNDPLITHLRVTQKTITQYDLDHLPEFKEISPDRKAWLQALGMEIFVPIILRQHEFMGILALGPKPHYRPYLEQTKNRIHLLASQIAIDIDKAKLFSQLGAVNQKMGSMTEKFNSLDQGKSDFLSIASHELRTPLTHIHGYASMLVEATENELNDPVYLQNVFSGIAKGSDRLKDIVDLIFDVSKAETGDMEISLGQVSLAEVLHQAVRQQQDAIEQRSHNLVISGIEQLPSIHGSNERLTQAMDQLINNAIKYTPDRGTITITGRTTVENHHPHVELIVTDTGIGIEPNDHKKVFEKFYRVGDINNHSTHSVKFKGAGPGLGLSLVAGIARAHGGRIWVESPKYDETECPGSQFHLVLPINPPEEAMQLEALEALPTSNAETRHWSSKDIEAIKQRLIQQQ